MAKNLQTITRQVDELRAEIKHTTEAIPPVDLQIAKVRSHMESLASEARNRLVDRAADVIAHGTSTFDLNPPPAVAPYHALGLAVAAIGVDTLMAEVEKLAAERDPGALRLTDTEKADRLADLRRRLYETELEEVEASPAGGARTSTNGAALLQIPYEIALQHNLIGGKE